MQSKMVNEIKGFENIVGYEIFEDGTVISYKKKQPIKLNPYPNTKGYLMVDLSTKKRAVKLHRLVAIAFLDNPENKPQVNHIDGNKKNNNASNLEWVTNSENQKHAYKHGLMKTIPTEDRYNYDKEHHMSKKVRQLDMNGNVIAEYFSFAQAARAVGLKSYTSISNAAKNDKLTAKGYKWELVE